MNKPACLCKQYPLAAGGIIVETDGGFGFIGSALGRFSIGNAFRQGIQKAIWDIAGAIS